MSSSYGFVRVWEVSLLWSVQVNILEARADSGFYRVLVKQFGMCAVISSQGSSVCMGFRYDEAVFILVMYVPAQMQTLPCNV